MLKALITATLIATPATANEKCAPYPVMAETLSTRFGETKVSEGIGGQGKAILQVWSNSETSTWSVLIVGANGVACLVAAGVSWTNHAANIAKGEKL